MESAFYHDDQQERSVSPHEKVGPKNDSPEIHKAPIAPHFEGLILLRDHEKQENQPAIPEHTPLQSVVEAPDGLTQRNIAEQAPETPATYLTQEAAIQTPHATQPGEAQSWQQRQQVEQHPVAGEAPAAEEVAHVPHIQQDAWRRYWVDEHGREIAGATTYGQAYYQERQVETQPTVSQVATPTTSYAPTPPAGAPNWNAQIPGVSPMSTTNTPQSPLNSDGSPYFAVGQPTPVKQVDLQHRLPQTTPRPLLQNPWLWLMLTIVMAAFFATIFI